VFRDGLDGFVHLAKQCLVSRCPRLPQIHC
jgi:hypothetical protein